MGFEEPRLLFSTERVRSLGTLSSHSLDVLYEKYVGSGEGKTGAKEVVDPSEISIATWV